MLEPPFLPAPPPGRALVAMLGPAPKRCLLAGPPGLARALGRAGHQVTRWHLASGGQEPGPGASAGDAPWAGPLDRPPSDLHGLDALILVGALTGLEDPLATLCRLVRSLDPGAWIMALEPAASGPAGRWLGRLLGRWRGHPVLSEASILAALFLGAGLREIVQRWPQGLRSVVLTAGRVSPGCAREP